MFILDKFVTNNAFHKIFCTFRLKVSENYQETPRSAIGKRIKWLKHKWKEDY